MNAERQLTGIGQVRDDGDEQVRDHRRGGCDATAEPHTRRSMSVAIQRVTAAQTFPLRQRVLRPRDTVDELSSPNADDVDTAHFAAVEDGDVIGAGSVRRETAPWATRPPERSWRIRGMATTEGRRSQGIGAAVLDAVLDHVACHGGGLVWCNARLGAVAFYERGGFVTRGQRWDDPTIGPHIAMERFVESATP